LKNSHESNAVAQVRDLDAVMAGLTALPAHLRRMTDNDPPPVKAKASVKALGMNMTF